MKAAKQLKKYGILIWLIAVALCLTTVVSFGAYKGVTTVKRVVSLSSRDGILFSSRYMSRNNTGVQSFLYTYDGDKSDEENTPVIMVDVCNYDLNQNVYDKNFHFKFKARLVHPDGTDVTAAEWAALGTDIPTDYKVAYASYADTTGVLTQSYATTAVTLTNEDQYIPSSSVSYLFPGADKTRYLFEVTFDLDDIKNPRPAYAVRIEAEVVEAYNDIQNIYGILKAVQGGETTQNTWNGKFMDVTEDRSPADYDGINYQISGNAEGTVKITYRYDVIEIDKDDYGGFTSPSSTISGNYKTISISVDPDTKSMYDIRFYWKNGPVNTVAFGDAFIKTEFEEQ